MFDFKISPKLRSAANALAVSSTMLAGGMLLAPSTSLAQGVPVFDSRGLLQQLDEFQQLLVDMGLQEEQITKLIEAIKLAQDQLDQLYAIEDLLSDPSQVLSLAMGADLDGILEGEFDIDMVGTILQGMQGDWSGIQGSDPSVFVDRVQAALQIGGTTQAEITDLATSGVVEAERNAAATTSGAATSAAAEIAYEEASQSVERIQLLMDEMPVLDSLKESVDHNTRVTAELAIAMAAMWQLESVQTMNVGMAGVLDAATLADIERFTDFTQPDLQ